MTLLTTVAGKLFLNLTACKQWLAVSNCCTVIDRERGRDEVVCVELMTIYSLWICDYSYLVICVVYSLSLSLSPSPSLLTPQSRDPSSSQVIIRSVVSPPVLTQGLTSGRVSRHTGEDGSVFLTVQWVPIRVFHAEPPGKE